MTPHPSECTLQDLLDDELRGEDLAAVQLHVEGCEECRTNLASTNALLRELKSLPTDAQGIPAPWNAPKQYPVRGFLTRLPAVGATAAVGIFAAGIFVGICAGRFLVSAPAHFGNGAREELTEEIQHSGTRYITAIAKWRREKGSASGAEQGREAILAALYGAAYELQKLRPEDRQLANVVRSVGDLRDRDQVLQTEP